MEEEVQVKVSVVVLEGVVQVFVVVELVVVV